MNSFTEEDLRNMSSTELRKCAKMNGVKANMKMDKIIAALLQKGDEDSFVTLENKILNSSKKNKETLFDTDRESFDISRRSTYTVEGEDSFVTLERKIMNSCKKKENMRPSSTPRRETYIVDEVVDDNKVLVEKSASPELKKPSRKSAVSKRKVSFMTPLRRSARISSATPVYNSVKDRPKTPMPNKSSEIKSDNVIDPDVPVIPLNLDVSTEEAIENEATHWQTRAKGTPLPYKMKNSPLPENLNGTPSPKKIKGTPLPKKIKGTPLPRSLARVNFPASNQQRLTPISTPHTIVTLSATKPQKSSPLLTQQNKATPFVSSRKRGTPLSTQHIGVTPSTTIPQKITPLPVQKTIIFSGTKQERPTPLLAERMKSTPLPGKRVRGTPLTNSLQKKHIFTPEFKKIITPIPKKISPRFGSRAASTPKPQMLSQKKAGRFGARAASTPKPQKEFVTKSATKTPNFKKIHQKEFEKMESLQDYQKRKQRIVREKVKEQRKYHTPAKSNAQKFVPAKRTKIPKVFGGIPFVSNDIASQDNKQKSKLRETAKSSMNTNDKGSVSKKLLVVNKTTLSKKLKRAGNVKAIKNMSRENSILKQRPKFDLNASLARKLNYKPHTGPLKPLNETNLNNTVSGTPLVSRKATENSLVKAKRFETKELLRGVRKNKRFLLLMNNRNMDTSEL